MKLQAWECYIFHLSNKCKMYSSCFYIQLQLLFCSLSLFKKKITDFHFSGAMRPQSLPKQHVLFLGQSGRPWLSVCGFNNFVEREEAELDLL